jgi:hypothetical protein
VDTEFFIGDQRDLDFLLSSATKDCILLLENVRCAQLKPNPAVCIVPFQYFVAPAATTWEQGMREPSTRFGVER